MAFFKITRLQTSFPKGVLAKRQPNLNKYKMIKIHILDRLSPVLTACYNVLLPAVLNTDDNMKRQSQ